ncbi:TonB-dependent receptor [Kordia sp.]|uniref:TonB-dependent receptor domain-containing protein n=1 Tax=Kordia sp. TaxID=1965332 RepID=UPI0025BC456F|nr:TonB-dependent receptor [Kordia sp.]MCH2195471.1 TonB-dependent receptor [Kordia sp.]
MKKVFYDTKASLIWLFIMLPCLVFAQVELSGSVKDETGPLPFANVVLKDAAGTVVTGTISDENGAFKITLDKGTYTVVVSFIGSKDWTKQITLNENMSLGEISLEADRLATVVVTARKKLIEYKPDRLVLNVENNISAAGGNAINALSVAPGIIIQNGSISMLGKGASRVMVDDRLIELSGAELVNYLNSISAEDIKSIEVITNPPAKYDAAGEGGLINIVMKKGKRNSWRNSTTLSLDQNTFNFYTLRNNFFYNKNKFRFTLSASGVTGDIRNKADLDIFFQDGPWKLDGDEKQKRDDLSGRFTVDYDLTDKVTIGVQYQGNKSNPDRRYRNATTIFDNNNNADAFIINNGAADLDRTSHSLNAHLESTLDTLGRRLFFDIDYFNYNAATDNQFTADIFDANGAFVALDQAARNISDQEINNVSVRADMEHPTKFANISYGAKYSVIRTDSDIEFFDESSGAPVFDPNQSNVFEYEENNQAVYVSASKNLNEHWSMQLGLRFEATQTTGFSQTLNQTNDNDYSKLFPTFYVSYAKENNSFYFNYGKRINRPSFADLNPFRTYINSTSFSEGNPFLQPSFTDNFELSYTYKRKWRTYAFANILSDGYGLVFRANEASNNQVITRENYYDEFFYGIGQSYSTDITKWWQSQNSVYLLGSTSDFDNTLAARPQNGVRFYATSNNTLSLGENTKMQVDYVYSSNYKRGLYEFGQTSGLNISFRQSFLDNKLNASVLFNDVFNSNFLRDYTSVVNNIQQIYNENNSSRFVRFSLTYNFGNNEINVRKPGFGNNEEQNRSKQ